MEHSTSGSHSGASQWSPVIAPGNIPEDCYRTWIDPIYQESASFSPSLHDLAFPLDTDYTSPGHSTTQDNLNAPPESGNWSADLAYRSYIDEQALSDRSCFPIHEHVSQPEVMQTGYQSFFTPTELEFNDQYFPSEINRQPVTSHAGFVNDTPLSSSSHLGLAYNTAQMVPTSFESAPVLCLQTQFDPEHNASAIMANGRTNRPYASPEFGTSGPPRRLSVAFTSPLASWSPEDINHMPPRASFASNFEGHISGYGHAQTNHAGSNASFIGSPGSIVSSSAVDSVRPGKAKRSMSAASLASVVARSEDNDDKPRSHKYYTTAKPHADGNYHCPYARTEGCPHKPTKLKCNYE